MNLERLNGSYIYPQENYDCDGNCIFEIDECGICNGIGPEEYYDCENNCLLDSDNDGVCDELEIFGCTYETALI